MKARKGGGRGETTDRQTLLNLHPLSAPERSHASHGSATQSGFCLLETAGSCVCIRRSKAHGEEAIRWGGGRREGGRPGGRDTPSPAGESWQTLQDTGIGPI